MSNKDVNYQSIQVVGVNKNNESYDHTLGLIEHVFDTSLVDATISGKPMIVDLEFKLGKDSIIIPLPFISVLYGTDMTAGGRRMTFDEQSNSYEALKFKRSDPQNNKAAFKSFVNYGSTETAIQLWNSFSDPNLTEDENLVRKLLPIVDINSKQYNNFICHALAMEYMLAKQENNQSLADAIANIEIMKQFDLSSFIDNTKDKNGGFVFSMKGKKNENMHLIKFGNHLYSCGLQPKNKNDNSFYEKFDDSNYFRFYDIVDNSLEAIDTYDGCAPNLPSNNE